MTPDPTPVLPGNTPPPVPERFSKPMKELDATPDKPSYDIIWWSPGEKDEPSGNSGEVESPKPDEGEELSIKVPTGYSFAEINEFVHSHVDFEDLQYALLGMASHFDKPTPPKPEGETPLTDALSKELEDSPVNIEIACEHLLDHARQLESDLAAARAEVEMSKEAIDDLSADFEQAKGHISTLKFDQLTLQTQLHNANLRNERLRAALEGAKKAIRELAHTGTERIRELGGECDDADKTADITIRRAGIEAALAPASSGKGEG